MRVENEADVGLITREIHDCWFSLDDITFDADSRTLRIPFEDKSNGSLASSLHSRPAGGGTRKTRELRVFNVESYEIEDEERVGAYDFNEFTYDPRARTISVSTGVPLGMTIVVSRFAVEVDTR